MRHIPMFRRLNPSVVAVALLATFAASRAWAQTWGGSAVTVTLGQPLQQKSGDLGGPELDKLTQDLARTVGRALAKRSGPDVPVALQLVLEDATPNRATPSEPGRVPSMSSFSLGLGGAWIDGAAMMADGRKLPVGFSYYESGIRSTFARGAWSDAQRAFAKLADELGRGRIPDQAAPGAPPRTSNARWPG